MMMNNAIPLAARTPDMAGSFMSGLQNRQQIATWDAQNALRDLFAQQGGQIMQGDTNALAALAQHDPALAMNIQRGQHGMQMDERRFGLQQQQAQHGMRLDNERLGLARQEGQRAAATHAAQMSEVERARNREELERAGRAAAMAWQQGPETFEAFKQRYAEMMPENMRGLTYEDAPYALEFLAGVGDAFAGPEFRTVTGPQAEAMGLDPQAAYNVGRDGKVTSIGGGGVSVNVNASDYDPNRPIVDKPPKGYQRIWDDQSQTYRDIPIPGSEEAVERSGGERAMQIAAQQYDQKFRIVDDNLNKAIDALERGGRWVAGAGSVLSGLPETAARDFQATVDTIKANLGFEELQAMRDSSPTGGALGQVTEREIAFLQAIQGNLDTAQSPKQLLEVLREIKTRRQAFANERQKIIGSPATSDRGIPPPPEGWDADRWGEAWEVMSEEDRALFR